MSKQFDELELALRTLTLDHLDKLAGYVPGPMKKAGGTKHDLQARYQTDPLFSIFGLDSPEYIAATLAGGTITSIHRRLGEIYESCVKAIFVYALRQAPEEVMYKSQIQDELRSADAYLQFDRLERSARTRIEAYCKKELSAISSDPHISLQGVGMEVRHCYQTGDSKRTQADEAMARHLLVSGILPIMPLFCNQSNSGVIARYRSVWIIKQGMESYDMVKEFSGFDFYDFMMRNKADFRKPIIHLLRGLSA